jgi:hypothetical protein
MKDKVLVRLKNGECAERSLPTPNDRGLLLSGSVGAGGRNLPDDVRAVQKALNNVPPEQGGPNPKLDEDGKIGPLTRAAIGAFQTKQFGWSDSRVDPDKMTITALRGFQPSPGSSAPPRQVSLGTMALVYATLPLAARLIKNALRGVEACEALLTNKAPNKSEAEDKFAALNVFFSLDKLAEPQRLPAVRRIKGLFQKMEEAIGFFGISAGVNGFFHRDPEDQPDIYAFTYAGGYTRKAADGSPMMSGDDNYAGPNLPENKIYICTGLEGSGVTFTAYNSVHELAHWVGPEKGHPDAVKDFSYRHKADFYNLPPETALRTADSYAMYSVAASERGLAEDATIFLPPMIIRGSRPK